jgi:hypothetical protein
VAVFSAIAGWTGDGAVSGLGSAAGFSDGVTVAAVLAAALALLAALTVPQFRPARTANVGAH